VSKRKIIKINSEKCNGCRLCLHNCPEGAIQIIDGKARLISDLFCDGLGACLGHCPQGAIIIEEREAEKYDERKVMENVVKQGKNVIVAYLQHLGGHGQSAHLEQAKDFLKEKNINIPFEENIPGIYKQHDLSSVCPGSSAVDLRKESTRKSPDTAVGITQLKNWPIQINLIPLNAAYFDGADLLIGADCVPFTYASFHQDLLKDKILLVGCPKLDDAELCQGKITQILKSNNIKSITCVHMEVPCCFGLVNIVKGATLASGKVIPLEEITISIKGERLK